MKNFKSKIIYYPDKQLLTPCKLIDLKVTDLNKIKLLFNEMVVEIKNIQGFYKNNCIGLSSNQLGYDLKVFVMSKYPKSETLKNKHFECYINPEIIEYSESQVLKWEGCISDRTNLILIKRPEFVKIKYTDLTGRIRTEELPPTKSRVAQHESDHLYGRDMYKLDIHDKIEIKQLEQDDNFYEEWINQEIEKTYLI